MKETDLPSGFLSTLLLTIFLFVTLFFALNKIDKYLRIQAVDQCAKLSKYEVVNSKDQSRISYPIVDVYKTCLKDKGY